MKNNLLLKRPFASGKIYTILFIVTIITNFLMLITFEYCDLDSMSAWTLDFWDLFFEGRLIEFYEYAALNTHGAFHANCGGNYLWLLPWCIWNFPLWIAHRITGTVLVTNFWSLFWSKLYLFMTEFLLAYYVGKICKFFTDDKNRIFLARLLVLSAPEVLMSVGYAGQDEIVYLCLFTMGLYYFLNNKKRVFYILMVFVVSFSPVMLPAVLLLFVLSEKNIIKVIGMTAGTFIPLVLFEFLYGSNGAYQSVKNINDFSEIIINMLAGTTLGGGSSSYSLAGIMLIAVFFIAYQFKVENINIYRQIVIYFEAIVFAVICFEMPTEYYRLFLYIPVMIILILSSKKNNKMNLFIFTVLTYTRAFVACATNNPQNMNTYYVMRNSWVTKLCDILGSNKYLEGFNVSLYNNNWVRNETMAMLLFIAATCSAGCMIILLAINYPKQKREFEIAIHQNASIVLACLCMPIILGLYYIMLFK